MSRANGEIRATVKYVDWSVPPDMSEVIDEFIDLQRALKAREQEVVKAQRKIEDFRKFMRERFAKWPEAQADFLARLEYVELARRPSGETNKMQEEGCK